MIMQMMSHHKNKLFVKLKWYTLDDYWPFNIWINLFLMDKVYGLNKLKLTKACCYLTQKVVRFPKSRLSNQTNDSSFSHLLNFLKNFVLLKKWMQNEHFHDFTKFEWFLWTHAVFYHTMIMHSNNLHHKYKRNRKK